MLPLPPATGEYVVIHSVTQSLLPAHTHVTCVKRVKHHAHQHHHHIEHLHPNDVILLVTVHLIRVLHRVSFYFIFLN